MRKKQFRILSILILITLFAFIGCNDDNLHEHKYDAEAGIKSRKISFNEFKNHTEAFDLVADVNKKQSESNSALNKIIKDTLNNFTIDTQEGLYLQYANLHSFTFPIHREEDNGKLENLVLSYQNDGSYKVKILKYDLTPQEKADLELDQLKNIQNPIITIPIENFNTNLVVNGCETITETIWVSCGHGVHNSSNVNSWPSCTSDTPPRVFTASRIKCIDAGDSTGGGEPIDDGFGSDPIPGGGGGPSDNNFPSDYPTPETNPEEYEEGISAPIKSPYLNAPRSTPCAELNKLTSNMSMQGALANLRTKTNLTRESGYSISKRDATNYNYPVACNASPNNPNEIKMPTGGTNIGGFHTHPLASATDVVPMFSDGDINWLFWVAQRNEAPRQGKVYEEFFLTLTVPQGTYAIKIKDWTKFSAFRNNKAWKNIDGASGGELYKLRHKYNKIRPNGNHNRMINAFLEILQEFDAGMGLYEANSELNGWSELVLAPDATSYNGNEPRKIPCQ
ncbi:hypothetical protein [Flavobacterium helocola]|uniref:DUF4329 domain-containing protein n=1 Tax=Flavobacterium helocola TaxID=3139139 RepID=A0ABU9I9D0_9FLAO